MYMHLTELLRARKRIAPHVRRTPLVHSHWLSALTNAKVWLKLESLQLSNSFKSRGAFNAVIALLERNQGLKRRIVTASAGNHGRALAAAAEAFDLPLVVFTPRDAPVAKLSAIRLHGAELRAEGRDYDDAERLAKAFAQETGAAFISPYNDIDVIAGAGTIALELVEDLTDVDTVVVPIGGGGLISGVAAALKRLSPQTAIFGVEAEQSCAFQTSLRAGRIVEIVPGPTIADGLGGNPDPETVTFGYIQRYVDDIVTVSEQEMIGAIVGLVDAEHVIAEGAGAAATAAIAAGKLRKRGRCVAGIVTGSNIDRKKLAPLLASEGPKG